MAGASEQPEPDHGDPAGRVRRHPEERYDSARGERADQGAVGERGQGGVASAQEAGGDLIEGVGRRPAQGKERGQLHRVAARTDDDQRPAEADHDAGPAARADVLAQQRHGERRDQDRRNKHNGARLGQGDEGERREEKPGRAQQEKRAQQLKAEALGAHHAAHPAAQQQGQQQHVEHVARPDHLGHGIGLGQVLGHRVHGDEEQRGQEHPEDAAPGAARSGGRRISRGHLGSAPVLVAVRRSGAARNGRPLERTS